MSKAQRVHCTACGAWMVEFAEREFRVMKVRGGARAFPITNWPEREVVAGRIRTVIDSVMWEPTREQIPGWERLRAFEYAWP